MYTQHATDMPIAFTSLRLSLIISSNSNPAQTGGVTSLGYMFA